MTWYVDSSAFVKLVQEEAESDALDRWLADRTVCSSDLLRTEARRVFAADSAPVRALNEALLATTQLIRLTPDVFDQAGLLHVEAALRSLDAIHIAAAMQLGIDFEGIVTYDRRMAAAAQSLGIEVAAPGT